MLGYLGPEGTFSNQAAINYAGTNTNLKSYNTIYSLINDVESGNLEKAIVPIENSIEGSVTATLDILAFDVNIYIIDEFVLPISENLMVKKGASVDDIQVIISHPQPIGQCSSLIRASFENVSIEFTESTAAAAKLVSKGDGSIACIGSESLAETYNLEIVKKNCSDENNNVTRFVVLSKKQNLLVTDKDKTSVVFALDDTPGSLYNALELLKKSNINMLKIESRPLKKELGKYMFFVDVEGNIDDSNIYFALDKLKQHASFYKLLGSYTTSQNS